MVQFCIIYYIYYIGNILSDLDHIWISSDEYEAIEFLAVCAHAGGLLWMISTNDLDWSYQNLHIIMKYNLIPK